MRKEFSQAVEKLAQQDDSIVFITGDLGYNALENLQQKLGKRFINAGVAEQNMVGVAAGFAHKGYQVICYSIAPFVVYRCLEQFRNDVGFHKLPVYLVGNGGGYGYGIMGSTHHALEDLACLSSLQNVKAWVPSFADEVAPFLAEITERKGPAYLRLGAGKQTPDGARRAGDFNILLQPGNATLTVFALGPIANNVLEALKKVDVPVNLVTAVTFPFRLNADIRALVSQTPDVLVAEEHVSTGGLAQQLSVQLLENGLTPGRFRSLRAEGYPNGLYGSQAYHQRLSGLDADHIAGQIMSFVSQNA
ncbi:transketolase C-terminal domain-containing protein [Ravibacter arvi]|uniref:Transketolase C-terminal domain-containing protein n=1 Tax=Ravibacter arvi TaxID=2051041 RepID=A0ABP8M0G5_9BACT